MGNILLDCFTSHCITRDGYQITRTKHEKLKIKAEGRDLNAYIRTNVSDIHISLIIKESIVGLQCNVLSPEMFPEHLIWLLGVSSHTTRQIGCDMSNCMKWLHPTPSFDGRGTGQGRWHPRLSSRRTPPSSSRNCQSPEHCVILRLVKTLEEHKKENSFASYNSLTTIHLVLVSVSPIQ